MIAKITGQLHDIQEHRIILENQGLFYEIYTPQSVIQRLQENQDQTQVTLITHYFLQIGPASGFPVLIGFMNQLEKDFFLQFIKVSGIGPKAAVKALDRPIADVIQGIENGDLKFLKTLPGIGMQRAKEIVAKLQGKIGMYGLIQDKPKVVPMPSAQKWHEEAVQVLIQLQYKKHEAEDMVQKALDGSHEIESAEQLLNEIYKQRVHG